MNDEKVKLKEDLEKEYSETNIKKVMEYCKKNVQSMDFNDDTDFYLCHAVNLYLFKNKVGKFDKEEAKFLTISLAKLGSKLFNIKQDTYIEVIPKEEYAKLRGNDGIGVNTLKNDKTHSIIYSEKVCDLLMSNDPDIFLRSIQSVLHEVVHSFQDEKMQRDYNKLNAKQAKDMYIMGMEDIIRNVNPEFYKKNYTFLLGENDAEKNGLVCAMHVLGVYNKKIYNFFDKYMIEERIKKYDGIINQNEKEIFGIKMDKSKNLIFMEFVTREVLKKSTKFLDNYPALKIAYHEDGTQKSTLELLEDRKLRIEQSKGLENDSINDINELFSTIINNRDMCRNDRIDEIVNLEEYIVSNNIQDEYVYELLCTRMKSGGLKKELIEERIQGVRKRIAEKYETEEKNTLKEDLKDYTCTDEEYKKNMKKREENATKEMLINEEKNINEM